MRTFDKILNGILAIEFLILGFVSLFTDWAPDPFTVELTFLYIAGIFFFRLMDAIFDSEEI